MKYIHFLVLYNEIYMKSLYRHTIVYNLYMYIYYIHKYIFFTLTYTYF